MLLDPSKLTLFIVASSIMVISPGPAVLYIITRSIDQGKRAGFASALGILTGTLVHVLAAAFGLSAILMTSALVFRIVKYAGAAYLIYLGLHTLFSKNNTVQHNIFEEKKLSKIFSQGIIVNILNPKAAVFFFAFTPQFADASRGSITSQILLLGLIFIGLALISDSLYVLLAGTLGNHLKNNSTFLRLLRYIPGSIYILLGITTAVSGIDSH